MSLNNELAQLALIACDASYNSATVNDQELAEYDDHENEPSAWHIPATWFNLSELNAWASVGEDIEIIDTGFGAVVYKNESTNEVLVALRGSDGLDPQDWYANLGLGITQWSSIAKGLLFTRINQAVGGNPNTVVHFTGQSLGGALAQYALYDYALTRQAAGTFDPAKLSLTTFNSLGAVDGLADRPVNAGAVLANVATQHFITENDIVSRLGSGNVNQVGNTYLLGFRDSIGNQIQTYYPSTQDAHRIESGFYRGFNVYGGSFANHAGAIQPQARLLSIPTLQQRSAGFSELFNDGNKGRLSRFCASSPA